MQSELHDGSLTLPPPNRLRLAAASISAPFRELSSRRHEPTAVRPIAGYLALAFIVLITVATVLYAAAGSSVVTMAPIHPRLFPGWEAGPLAHILPRPLPAHRVGLHLLTWSSFALAAAYLLAVLCARSMRMRFVWVFVAVTGLVLLLGPPERLNDVFNYLGYARLGAAHGLDPYTHVIGNERGDTVFAFTSWRNLSSPYGPLFTGLTYPLGLLPLPVAYWVLKITIVATSFAFLYFVNRCAVLLGRNPAQVIVFVAANPLYLFYELAGFHNDFLMLLPSTAAIALVLAGRERASGAAIAVAIAVKFTTVVLLPFLLIAAWRSGRWPRVLQGVAAAALPLALFDVALFGLSLPNIADQSGLVTGFSIPNLTGIALGFGGGTHAIVRLFELAVVVVVLLGLRRRDWVAGAGWAQLGVIAGVAWLMPWYLVWLLPLAALAQSAALRRAALLFTMFLLITFLPQTGTFLARHGFDPSKTALGRANSRFEQSLQWQHRRPSRGPGGVSASAVGPLSLAGPSRLRRSPGSGTATGGSATIAHRCRGCTRLEAPTAWSATTPTRSSRRPPN